MERGEVLVQWGGRKKKLALLLSTWPGLKFLPSNLSIPRSGSQAIYPSQCGVCKSTSNAGLEVTIETGDGVARLNTLLVHMPSRPWGQPQSWRDFVAPVPQLIKLCSSTRPLQTLCGID